MKLTDLRREAKVKLKNEVKMKIGVTLKAT
jgi:hypothetical protein